MADFSIRSDSVDVEQIMRQIRARIREKRGADYTEAELQQLANVKLEKFLDPRGLRSDLVEQFRRHRVVSPEPPKYEFEDTTLYDTHRGALRTVRRLLHPILKLFLNPNPLIHALHVQKNVNAEFHRRFRQREEMDPLYYEVIHNLVVEVTRLGIEVHNLKMRVESLSSRVEFDERRSRALEGVVQYKRAGSGGSGGSVGSAGSGSGVQAADTAPRAESAGEPRAATPTAAGSQQGSGERRRRRRRRRRRPGQTMADAQGRGAAAFGAADGPTAGEPAESPQDDETFDEPAEGPEGPNGPEGPEGPTGSGSDQ